MSNMVLLEESEPKIPNSLDYAFAIHSRLLQWTVTPDFVV